MSDIFDDKNQVKSAFVKFGKIGDNIQGTLIDVREMKSAFPGQEDVIVKIYDIQADGGFYHDIDEETKKPVAKPTDIKQGEVYSVGGRSTVEKRVGTEKVKLRVLMGMSRIKIGQKVGLKFIDTIKSKQKGFSDTKVIRVFTTGEMDPEFMAGTEGNELNEEKVGF